MVIGIIILNENYIMFYSLHRKAIFTVLMIASIRNNIPMHSEAQFYKLPKEILLYIFRLLCESTDLILPYEL